MHRTTLHNCRKSIRFRYWSRKSYAVFGSLHRHVTIGKVGKGIADSALDKAKTVLAQEYGCRNVQGKADDDSENLSGYADCVRWGNGECMFVGLFAAGSASKDEAYAGLRLSLFVIHKSGVTKQPDMYQYRYEKVASSLRSFYTYSYDNRVGKES